MARINRPVFGYSVYLALALAIIMIRLAPFTTAPPLWPAPDVLVALTFIYALRRPQVVGPLLVGGVFLLADLLFFNPPGLKAALVVLATETLSRRAHGLRSSSAVAEWILITFAILTITVVERIALIVLMVPRPDLGPVLIGALGTIAIVPVVDGLGRLFLGLRRAAHGERDERGQRI